MVSLPAARAVRIYGAEISAADDMAVAATNCRRESFFRDIWRSSLVSQSRGKSRCYFFFPAGGQYGPLAVVGDFVARIRAELPASVEKSGAWRRRTNVVLKLVTGRFSLFAHELSGGSEPGAV